MRAGVLEVVWHAKQPVYSVDFHPDGTLVSAGADKEIRLWEVIPVEGKAPTVKPICSLANHQRSINVVRFSPSGDALVSGGDHGELVLWAPAGESRFGASMGSGKAFGAAPGFEEEPEEKWRYRATLRGHHSDVNDVSWSPDGTAVVSGSVENIAILWDVSAGRSQVTLNDHKNYVQGVAWSPLGDVLATQSADRTFRVYGIGNAATTGASAATTAARTPYSKRLRGISLQAVAGKWRRPTAGAAAAEEEGKDGKGAPGASETLLRDENTGFFKRLAWSPDGTFLAVPGGRLKSGGSSSFTDATLIFKRGNWSQPALHLPFPGEATVAVRFNPVLFKLREGQPQAEGFDLPYSMVFAVATTTGVVVYSTQESTPVALLGRLHFEQVTDLAWSPDGRTLACSSVDGYCSIAVFEEGELGEPLPASELPAHLRPENLAGPAEGKAAEAEAEESAGRAGEENRDPVVSRAEATGDKVKGDAARRRIAPEPLQPAAATTKPLPEQKQQQQQQQQKRRIAPQPVAGSVADAVAVAEAAPTQTTKTTATPSRRRIAPTPLRHGGASPVAATEASAAPASAGPASAAAPAGEEPKRRRITPTECP